MVAELVYPLPFDRPIRPGGYRWHYVDGLSDDGESAIVIIAMLGNPFSPRYARARERGPADALGFCTMNVALYGRARAWALHERSIPTDAASPVSVTIGGSTMAWERDRLVVDLDERTTPFHRPLRGRIVVTPECLTGAELPVDDRGEHAWWPVAPLARIEVELREPRLGFAGHGYLDANAGDAPLEASFSSWIWSRARSADAALVTYDVTCAGGAEQTMALRIDRRGAIDRIEGTTRRPLPRTTWKLDRFARADERSPASIVRSLEDGPFYARALVDQELGGVRGIAMHETLAAHRLRRAWVRHLVGYRMRSER